MPQVWRLLIKQEQKTLKKDSDFVRRTLTEEDFQEINMLMRKLACRGFRIIVFPTSAET